MAYAWIIDSVFLTNRLAASMLLLPPSNAPSLTNVRGYVREGAEGLRRNDDYLSIDFGIMFVGDYGI